MSRLFYVTALVSLTLLGACSESDTGPGAGSDLRGGVLDVFGNAVADAAVFLQYDLQEGAGGAPNGLAAKPATVIHYELPTAADVSVWVSGFCKGDTVRSLVQGSSPGGMHEVVWDGLDDSGRLLPDGVYWVEVRTPTGQATSPAALLHVGYPGLTADTDVAALARSDDRGHFRLGQDCLPLGFAFTGTDELGEPTGTATITRRVRVWASHPDHGVGHTGWLAIDDERGLVADVTLR